MAWTQTDVDNLKVAIANGTKRVTFADRTVEYPSLPDLIAALALAQAEVNATTGTPRPKQFLAYESGKGI